MASCMKHTVYMETHSMASCMKHTVWPHGSLRKYKESVLLRNVSPFLVLSDLFPGGGILELQTGSSWEWPFIVCLFWE